MHKDETNGSAKKLGGKVKESIGGVTGDRAMEADGRADQAEGSAQKAADKVKDAAPEVIKR